MHTLNKDHFPQHSKKKVLFRPLLYSLLFVFVFLLVTQTALASTIYTTQGVNNRGSGSQFGLGTEDVTVKSNLVTTDGTPHQPVVYDFDNDGKQEIVLYTGGNQTTFFDGNNPTIEQTSFLLGKPVRDSVACDADNDGKTEYVGVFNNGTSTFLTSINYDNGQASLGALLLVNESTEGNGAVRCSQFYSPQGDMRNYTIFVDDSRQLWIARASGSGWTWSVIDVQDAVTEEAGLGDEWYDRSDPIILRQADPLGQKVIAFVAGEKLITYYSNDLSGSLSFTSLRSRACSYHLLGQQYSSTTQRVILGFDLENDACIGGFGVDANVVQYQLGRNFFTNNPSIVFKKLKTINYGGAIDEIYSAYAVGFWDDDSTEDVIIVGKKHGVTNFRLTALEGQSFDILTSVVKTDVCDGTVNYVERAFMVDMDGDTDLDVLTSCFNDTFGFTDNEIIFWMDNNASDVNVIGEFDLPGVSPPAIGANRPSTPVPVDANKDGLLDLIYQSHLGYATLMSSVLSSTQEDFPFSVFLKNTTSDLRANMNVRLEYDQQQASLLYTAVCSVETQPIWVENFNLAYNFSSDVSVNNLQPTELLTFDGLDITIPWASPTPGVNFTTVDLVKDHSEGVRDIMVFEFGFLEGGSREYDVIAYDSNDEITWWFILNKTGSNLAITKFVPFQGSVLVNGTIPLATSEVLLEMVHTPIVSTFDGKRYFEIDFIVNGVTVFSENSNIQFDGSNIKKVEVFTNDLGQLLIKRLSLSRSTDLNPPFVSFQNGLIIEDDPFTIKTDSPQGEEIIRPGFTIFPGHNQDFSMVCQYEEAGTYTQRHYLEDYTNFKEVVVTVTGVATGGVDGDAVFSGDELVKTIDSFLLSLFGINSPLAKMLFWTALLIVVGFFTFPTHPILGVISVLFMMVIGALIGYFPVWIVVVLAIIAVAALTIGFRSIFVGGG